MWRFECIGDIRFTSAEVHSPDTKMRVTPNARYAWNMSLGNKPFIILNTIFARHFFVVVVYSVSLLCVQLISIMRHDGRACFVADTS